eukprot:gene14400-15899_t
MAPRPKAKRRFGHNSLEKVLALTCRWQGCVSEFELHLDDYQTFAEHVMQHINQFIQDFHDSNENHQDVNDCDTILSNNNNNYKCAWNNCYWEAAVGNVDEFTRHVMFHAYHSRLKCLGAFEIILQGVNQCSLNVETPDLLPEVGEPFLCKWDTCGMNLLCPEKFYKHVEMHAYNAGREDVMVVTEDNGKLYSLPTCGQTVNGMAVQKLLQSVCRWDGCSFLAKSAVKIKDHCRTHTGERQLACPTCGGFFSNKTKFIDHLTRQNTKLYENFQCSHCLKRCASERLLRDHMRHHVNHVKCPHCDMTCANPSALRSHIKFRHSKDRPYECAMCSYSCKAANDLKRHEETHFAKRFECEEENCGFLARTMSGLRSHVKLAHTEKRDKERFMCHICQKQFSRGYFLTKHLKSDHDFSWPSGHIRFQYKKHEDGFCRLQMVRFESAELSELLTEDDSGQHVHQINTQWINEETGLLDAPMQTDSPSIGHAINETSSSTVVDTHTASCSTLDALYTDEARQILLEQNTSASSSPSNTTTPLEVNLCDGYVEILNYYEAVNADEKNGVGVAKCRNYASKNELPDVATTQSYSNVDMDDFETLTATTAVPGYDESQTVTNESDIGLNEVVHNEQNEFGTKKIRQKKGKPASKKRKPRNKRLRNESSHEETLDQSKGIKRLTCDRGSDEMRNEKSKRLKLGNEDYSENDYSHTLLSLHNKETQGD